jgi:hypothetical protein
MFVLRLVPAALMTACVLASAAPSAALAGWSSKSIAPTIAALPNMSHVACPGSTTCFATGGAQTEPFIAGHARLEGWNGSTWTGQTVPLPPGTEASWIRDISCASTTACMAVGSYRTIGSFPSKPLVLWWNGTSWSSIGAPAGTTVLTGVSCPSATSCVAINDAGSGLVSVLSSTTWNGTSWSAATSLPTPSGAASFNIGDLDCSSAAACTAAGVYAMSVGGTNQDVVEQYDGTSWTIAPVTQPTYGGSLNDVSCPTATDCVAVGAEYDAAGDGHPSSQIWDGTTWTLVSVSTSTPGTEGSLHGLDCTSAAHCVATGQEYTTTSAGPFVVVWNGSGWVNQTLPGTATADTGNAVSCSAATQCTLVGNRENFIRWNGASWSMQTGAGTVSAKELELSAVSCVSGTCTAFGSGQLWDGSFQVPYQTVFTSSTTKILPPNNTSAAGVKGVSCFTSSTCTIVGNSTRLNGSLLTAAFIQRSPSWAQEAVPVPAGATSTRLEGVSCPSATTCRAVGSYTDSTGATKLTLLGWGGTTWTTFTPPAIPGTDNALNEVSCTVLGDCMAVGTFTLSGVERALAVVWNGTTWSLALPSMPSGGTSSRFTSVSCIPATGCTAVGSYVVGGVRKTLAERYNGTTWTVQTTPNPATATSAQLNAVSCIGTSNCSAVGSYVDATSTKTLGETWVSPTWSLSSTPVPASGATSTLDAVSCTATTVCTAVGNWVDGSGKRFALGASGF